MRRTLGLLIILAITACPGSENDPAGTTDTPSTTTGDQSTDSLTTTTGAPTSTDTPTSTAGATTEVTTGGSDSPDNLFACGLPIDCSLDYFESVEPSQEAEACAGKLALANAPGIVSLHLSKNVPNGIEQNDLLYILLGDARVLRQRRSRSCMDCTLDELPPWEPQDPQMECWLYLPVELESDCADDNDSALCAWPGVHDCSETEVRSCADILALLGG